MKTVHIAITHKVFDPRVFHKECVSLVRAGYDVSLISDVQYDFEAGGVKVKAFERRRTGNHLLRWLTNTSGVYRIARDENADIYHLHEPSLVLVALMLKMRGQRVIWDVHELVAEQLLRTEWMPYLMRRASSFAYRRLQTLVGRLADGVIVAWPRIAEEFAGMQPTVIRNFPLLDQGNLHPSVDYDSRARVAAYVGGLTDIRGIAEMVRAMELLNINQESVLLLGGEFGTRMFRDAVEMEPGWRYVQELGWLDEDAKAEVYQRSRVGLLLLDPTVPNHLYSEPNKLFEYMLAGLPVVSTDIPYYRQFVEAVGSGLMVDASNPESIAEAVEWIFSHPEEAEQMGRRGRESVLKEFNWDIEAPKLIALYERINRR